MKTLIMFIILTMISTANLATQQREDIWVQQETNVTEGLMGINATDTNTVWAVGQSGTILHTNNGGDLWTLQSAPTTTWLRDVSFADENNGWTCGNNGVILHTNDGGNIWTQQASPVQTNLWAMSFVDDQNGWIVGQDGKILYTDNGGVDWNEQTSNTDVYLWDVYFFDENIGWTVGIDGVILKTIDGGQSWSMEISGTNQQLYSVFFVDEQIGWITGRDGLVLHSNDGGITWEEQTSNVTANIYNSYFVNENTGWCVGAGGVILFTSDGGESWVEQESNVDVHLWDIDFATTTNIGWIAGMNGTILYTETGGYETGFITGEIILDSGDGNIENIIITANDTTTSPQPDGGYELELYPGIYDIYAELEYYCEGWYENVEVFAGETTDNIDLYLYYLAPINNLTIDELTGEVTWEEADYHPSLTFEYYQVYLDDVSVGTTENNYWQFDDLVHGEEYECSIIAVYLEGESPLMTESFTYLGTFADDTILSATKLYENYPNPFNPYTNISFFLSSEGKVLIDIYNIKGEKVTTLVNETFTAGHHTISWDGRDNHGQSVGSGVFIYRMKTEEGSISKKMLMIK